MSFEAESWKNLWLLTGLKYVATYNPGEELFFGGQYGVLVGMYPETKVRYAGMYGASARTEEGNTSTNIAGALFCGFRIHYVSFSIRYLIGDLEFDTIYGTEPHLRKASFLQPSRSVMILLGVVF
jgi:hypothetical protein